MPDAQGIRLTFPSMPPDTPAWVFPGFISDLNSVYEVLVLATAIGYEGAVLPASVRIRRSSMLVPEDRLVTRRIKYGSPWQADLVVAGIDVAQHLVWPATSLAALKFLPAFLDEGVDLAEKLATWRHRTRMREREELEAAARTRQVDLENKQLELDLRARREAWAADAPEAVRSGQDEPVRDVERSSRRPPRRAAGASDSEVTRITRAARERLLTTAQGAPEAEELSTDDDEGIAEGEG